MTDMQPKIFLLSQWKTTLHILIESYLDMSIEICQYLDTLGHSLFTGFLRVRYLKIRLTDTKS